MENGRQKKVKVIKSKQISRNPRLSNCYQNIALLHEKFSRNVNCSSLIWLDDFTERVIKFPLSEPPFFFTCTGPYTMQKFDYWLWQIFVLIIQMIFASFMSTLLFFVFHRTDYQRKQCVTSQKTWEPDVV